MKRKPVNIVISKEAKERLNNPSFLRSELAAGKTPQELIGFSDAEMADLYQKACQLIEDRHYVDAANAFLFLASLNAHQHDYWLGLGMATQLYGDFEAAIDAYELAAICDVENPIPYFYLAKCLFAIHERESAIEALEMTIAYAADHQDYQNLKEQAQAALRLLESAE